MFKIHLFLLTKILGIYLYIIFSDNLSINELPLMDILVNRETNCAKVSTQSYMITLGVDSYLFTFNNSNGKNKLNNLIISIK